MSDAEVRPLSTGSKVTDTRYGHIGKIVKYGRRTCKVRIPIFGRDNAFVTKQIPTRYLKERESASEHKEM